MRSYFMTYDTLSRTNIQALWRYLPGQPFNWASKMSVIGETPRQVSALDVPENWVIPQLRRLIRPFAEASSGTSGRGPELDVIERGQFALVKAEDLRASRFPNTFHCGVCGTFRAARIGAQIPSCPKGHGSMDQFSWVEVHECGHLAELAPPACERGCRSDMELHNTRAFQTARWYWRCAKCRTRSDKPIVRWCSTCRNGRSQALRVPQNMAYYPQQITVINPPSRSDYAAIAHDQVNAAAVAQSLGILPSGADGLRSVANSSVGGAVAQFKQVAAALGWKPGDTLYEQGLADARAKEGHAPAWADEVKALGLDQETLEALGEECRSLSLASTAAELTVDDLIRTSQGGELEPTYRRYPELFQRYGLRDVTLLRELPIAYLVAGYTRVSSKATSFNKRGEPVTTKFRFFPASRDSKLPMYGVRTETEGLMFRLDQLQVVRWLVESGMTSNPGVTTQRDAQRWLFQTVDPINDIFNEPEDRITRAVLGLTHSIAHRAMKALAARCGLNVDSLAEYLFPSNCAFLIYANTRSEFVLGGLEHVYRFDLHEAIEELDGESRCVFDPPCRESFGGACAACLHVSEVGCARFNTVLDRNLIFGSVPVAGGSSVTTNGDSAEETQWRAYWRH
jgi:hypothetical protein